MEEEYNNEFLDITNFENDKITDTSLKKRVKELEKDKGAKTELAVIVSYIKVRKDISDAKSLIKVLNADLLKKVTEKYPQLTEVEIKDMVINDKWLETLSRRIDQQMKHIVQSLTSDIISLVDRYETTLVELDSSISKLEKRVNTHLEAMGFNW